MQFRTTFQIAHKNDFLITHQSKILTIGSCFSDVIGTQLLNYKFDAICNPFGTLYNPISIFQLLQNTSPNLTVDKDGTWYSLAHHSSLFAESKNVLENNINELQNKVHKFLSNCDYVIITLGTAFVFKHIESDNYVSNCHKLPAVLFEKSLLSVSEITVHFDTLLQYLTEINPKIKVIFTVSPVRHTKDTIELNAVSKSTLRLACHYFCQKYSNVSYFPAYELMLDDLRDYRFYKSDMIHPNEVAEQYIWEKWIDTYFDSSTKDFINEWKSILTDINHRTFDNNSAQNQLFVQNTILKIAKFSQNLDVQNELNILKARLA